MSCFILNDSRFQDFIRTFEYLQTVNRARQVIQGYWIGAALQRSVCKLGYKVTEGIDRGQADYRAFVVALRAYNHKAVNETYKNSDHIDKQESIAELSKQPGQKLSLIQLMKSLECFNYQTIDCAEYEGSKEREFIEQLINDIARSIVDSLPEYDVALWG